MSDHSKFYLARNQKTFGPLSAQEVEVLRQSGELSSYTWIFREGDSQWSPTDPAPGLPVKVSAAPAPRPAQARSVTAERLDPNTFRAILFDQRNAASGWLASASDYGCEVLSDQGGSDPLFVQKETLCLSLYDARSGEAMKLKVRVSEISRTERGWSYQLRWSRVPALLNRSVAA